MFSTGYEEPFSEVKRANISDHGQSMVLDASGILEVLPHYQIGFSSFDRE